MSDDTPMPLLPPEGVIVSVNLNIQNAITVTGSLTITPNDPNDLAADIPRSHSQNTRKSDPNQHDAQILNLPIRKTRNAANTGLQGGKAPTFGPPPLSGPNAFGHPSDPALANSKEDIVIVVNKKNHIDDKPKPDVEPRNLRRRNKGNQVVNAFDTIVAGGPLVPAQEEATGTQVAAENAAGRPKPT
ncbi:hypothetical protein CC80DRAFT_504435 [Byssothecium circinans]|uniref:Uncharacterized protein n=1 Tax=Byssothecium circinans TaxID=147558 RepID=A0A6A5U0S8_9PLEO|nr:hypothetical protein CC80DRAFT_504435 [Byssothecium circinans]